MKKKNFFVDVIEVIVISVVITFLLFNYVLISVRVNGSSMYPTLKEGDFGYSFVITKNIGINRFDICVVDAENKKLVKRVVGLPTETISYSNNQLYVNGTEVEEDFLNDVFTDDFSITLKDDEYFCMGDNRGISKDSRYYGAFKKDDIVSTHLLIVYPFKDAGFRK